MKKLKLNFMQILKDVLLRWSNRVNTMAIQSEQYKSPSHTKAHVDTPIKAYTSFDSDSPAFNKPTGMRTFNIMKKGDHPEGQMVNSDGADTQDRITDLESIIFEQKNEIRKLKLAVEEKHNSSDLSVGTQDAENELKNPEKIKERHNELRKEKDRLEHIVFSLESDKNTLQEERDNLIEEIEKNENMVNNLKEHITNLDSHRIQMEAKIEQLGDGHHPEQIFGVKSDYHKKLNDKLDEIQQIIIAISEINGITPPEEETEFEENPILSSLISYKPELPLSASETDIIVPESNDLPSIIETINSFLKFIRTRAQMVIEEYDDYHQTMIHAKELSKKKEADAEF